ncbi:RluA family pseudouridine synthase [Siculibacillus lacustris]|uniref:Pseudouridine synthase n=1 Tax=Siculibacillus lacustris TaxID=1549641 RepID=A0A4Q9VGE1_9HYPH|nr:RluA family pseudouridine synthase [Siculibacillus lacustris]TBW34067.1 RluA family pseudouridine synthase [Siculibacillus lacustris]
MAIVETITVGEDEAGMRLDRWFKAHYPGLAFGALQKLARTGQVRIDGKRVETSARVMPGQMVRVPPLPTDLKESARPQSDKQPAQEGDAAFLKSRILFEDADVIVLNKPAGLSVQGGSGVTRHVDAMLESLIDSKGQVPRLVHRLDKDTAGCLVIAKRRSIAAALAATFRSRSARKIYWALVAGVPHPRQGKISTWLAKDEENDGEKMRVARHGEQGAAHALTHYSVVDQAAQSLSWLSLKPTTGRTHQLRAHTAHIGHPIVGDPKYFDKKDWELPGGMQNKLHLLARRIVVPHPGGRGIIDVTAPLPPHMKQSWNLLGFDTSAYDPEIEEAIED